MSFRDAARIAAASCWMSLPGVEVDRAAAEAARVGRRVRCGREAAGLSGATLTGWMTLYDRALTLGRLETMRCAPLVRGRARGCAGTRLRSGDESAAHHVISRGSLRPISAFMSLVPGGTILPQGLASDFPRPTFFLFTTCA